MEEFINKYSVAIISALVSLFVTIFTTVLTHILGKSKLRYKEKVKIIGKLSIKKYEGITKLRSEIGILAQYEDLCITENIETLIPENIGSKNYTPSCCYTYETLFKITSTLNDLYLEYGHCLRHTSVIYLIYISNFLLDYGLKCQRASFPEDMLRWISVPLYPEILKWYKMFDKELIHSMNKPSTKYYAHSGLQYNFLLKLYGCYFKKSKPYKFLNNKNSLLNITITQPNKMS